MLDPKYKILFERRNALILHNEEMYDLTRDSYIGGSTYCAEKYLIRNSNEIEPPNVFQYRAQMASYTNYVEPSNNIIVGAIYKQAPDRSKVPSFLDYVSKNIYKGKGIDLFMYSIGIQRNLYPVAILIDSPRLTGPLTRAERELQNLNPYAVIYKYNEIRDFSFDSYGRLQWILLDNTYLDDSDPMSEPVTITTYTLWTDTQAISFTKDSKDIVSVDAIDHNLGEVPVTLTGLSNLDNDSLQSNPFQNIALASKKIYNIGSMIDCSLFNGTFQILVYPGTAPEKLTASYGSVAILEVELDATQLPTFIKQGMDDITPYSTEIQRQQKDIYHQLGFKDPESEKIQYDSGKMKVTEFAMKTQNILRNMAIELEHTENEIYRIAALYDQETIEPSVKYNLDFTDESIAEVKEELDSAFKTYPYDRFKKELAKQRATITLKDKVTPQVLQEVNSDIDGTIVEEQVVTEETVPL